MSDRDQTDRDHTTARAPWQHARPRVVSGALTAICGAALIVAAAPAQAATIPATGTPATGTPATTATPSPTPSESATPTPEPTESTTPAPEPTESGTPTPEPTESDGSDESGDGDGDSGDSGPTAPATDSPAPTPTDTENPDKAYDDALEGAQTKAVAEAQRLIAETLGQVGDAETTLASATAEAQAAREASDEAARTLAVTEESVARTQREIAALREQQAVTKQTLGVVASEAYQGSGSASTMGALFSSSTPAELTDKYVGINTLLQANDSALGSMAEGEADLRNAESQLAAQLEDSRQQAADAEALAESTAQAQQAAEAAQAELQARNDKLEHALQLAEDARLEDYQKYLELIGESTALGDEIRDLTSDPGSGPGSAPDSGPGIGTGDFVRPGTGEFTSLYGPRLHPILGYVKTHTGLDFSRGDGTIYAADSGTVIKAEWNNAYGYMVVIDHGTIDGANVSTMYAHQPGLSVSTGQRVEKGQRIGQIGSTGYSTGPHLHFEVYVDGEHTDPMPWVENAPSPG